MKLIIIWIMIVSSMYGEIEIRQNIKALYNNVELNEYQEQYVFDNESNNIESIKQKSKRYENQIKSKNLRDKNVVEFWLYPNNEIKDFRYLSRANHRELDKFTKEIIINASKELKTPKEKVPLRYIIEYDFEKKKNVVYVDNQVREKIQTYKNIPRGTTFFEFSTKEYTREFTTQRDGFINFNVTPNFCIEKATLLTEKGQMVRNVGTYNAQFNVKAFKGRYKLLIQTAKDCNVNLSYE